VIHPYQLHCLYRVIQEESAILWEMILCVILSKKVHMNMGPILNGYRDMVKRKYGPSCEHEQQLRNKKHHMHAGTHHCVTDDLQWTKPWLVDVWHIS